MNKKIKILLIAIVAIAIGGMLVWKFIINKSNDDFADVKPSQTFTFEQIMEQTSSDTASFNKLKNELVAVNGNLKKITKDEKTITLEIGDSTSMSSIICQCDERHLADLTSLKEGSPISVKGKITGFSSDELGLGNTIEMNFTTLNK